MAIQQKFTDLPTVANSTLSDIICAVQGYVDPGTPGTSTQQTLSQVLALMSSNIIQSNAGNPNGAVAGNAYQFCWDTVNNKLWVCTTSGTIVTAVWQQCIPVVTTPTASTIASWDANTNFRATNMIEGYATTVTAAGTTVLTVTSPAQQFFTGATTQTVTMPVASTCSLGQKWLIVNNSSGIVTVQSSGANSIIAMPAGTNSTITCVLTSGTTAASWNAESTAGVAGVTSITGTTNQVIANQPSGAVTLSLPQDIATTSSTQFDSVSFSNTTHGIVGTTTNNSAAVGYVGQFVTSNVPFSSATPISTTTPTTLTSISLTAGDWQVGGNIFFIGSGAVLTNGKVGISTTTNTFPDNSHTSGINSLAMLASNLSFNAPEQRISISGTTTVYIIGQTNFGSGSATQCGNIWARRLR